MFRIACAVLLSLSLSTKVIAQDVVCAQLSPPQHGSISATDSNKLYSKVTYSCDTGYSIQGPPSHQCLPVPFPNSAVWVPQDVTTCVQGPQSRQCLPVPNPFHKTGIWEPQVNEKTSCVEDVHTEMSEGEHMEPLLIYDPKEDEIPAIDLRQSVEYQSMHFVEDISDVEVNSMIEAEAPAAIPPTLLLATNDEELEPYRVPSMSLKVEANVEADELCVPVNIPEEYQCRDTTMISTYRWTIDTENGECVNVELCADDDEISISGLFHAHDECEKRCLS